MSRLIRNNYRRLTGAAVLVLACAMSACVTPPITSETRAQTSPKTLQLASGDGLLAIKIAINRPQVSPLFRKFTTLAVWNEGLQKEFELKDFADPGASHAFFVGSLPPGSYTVRAIRGEVSNPMIEASIRTAANEKFPVFTVAAGRLTDLGNIAYIRAHYPATSTQYHLGQVYAPHDRQAELRQLSPALAALVGAQPALGWEPGERLAALQARYDNLRSVSMLVHSPKRLDDGRLLFGEAFGNIAVRSPDGTWDAIPTPTALPIRSVHALGDGTLFAGSDDGVLFTRPAGQADWRALALPLDDASVIDIGPLPASDQLLVILQTRDRFIGLSTSVAAPGQWTEQFSQPRQLFRASAADARGFVLRAGDDLALVSGSNIAQQKTIRYDRQARTWAVATLDTDGLPECWAMLPDGRLARFQQVNLSRDRFFELSSDSGMHWDRRAELHFSWGSLLFVSNDIGYVVRANGPPQYEYPESAKGDEAIWRTDDAGRTWREMGAAPAFPRRLVQLGGTDHLGFVSDDGRFYSSTDGGKHWVLERRVP